MNTKTKKLLATSLVGVTMLGCFPSTAFADSTFNSAVVTTDLATLFSDKELMQEMEQYAIEKNNVDFELCTKYKNIFDAAYANQDITINTDGTIKINESLRNKLTNDEFNVFSKDMDIMNNSIELGIVYFDQNTNSFITKDTTVILNNFDSIVSKINLSSNTTVTRAVDNLNLGSMVHKNYLEIENYFLAQIKYNPDGAHIATGTYWGGKLVGVWNYKDPAILGPYNHEYNCTYGLNSSKHVIHTAEFIGNYNYGYTGSLLYNLPILKAGSFAFAKFDPSDFSDHPAIEEGYYDSLNIE